MAVELHQAENGKTPESPDGVSIWTINLEATYSRTQNLLREQLSSRDPEATLMPMLRAQLEHCRLQAESSKADLESMGHKLTEAIVLLGLPSLHA